MTKDTVKTYTLYKLRFWIGYTFLAAIVLAVILAATGLGIGYSGLEKIVAENSKTLPVPGALALVAAVISIVVKEAMYWYTRYYAKQINSSALMADAWHHRSDALSSVGSFVGVLGARMGFPVMDPLASVVICIFILKAAYDIFNDAVEKMVDKSCDDRTEEEIEKLVKKQNGVLRVDNLKTRMFGNKIYVDVEIAADGNSPLKETHAVAEKVHQEIEKKFPDVKHIMVHVNPFDNEEAEDDND